MSTSTPSPPPTPSDRSPAPPPEGSSSRGLWALILVLLAPAVVLPLWVGLYDRTDPHLAGFPFYFWFQFALILVAAVLTFAAYLLAKAADRRDRAAREGRASTRPVGGEH
jgi:membrane protein implicated in regulation of membrane protease activity